MTESPLLVSSPSETSPEELANRLLADFKDQYGLNLVEDPAAVQRVLQAAENALSRLGHQDEVEIYLPYISANASGPLHIERLITRVEPGGFDGPDPGGTVQETHSPAPQRVQVPLPDGKALVTTSLLILRVVIYILQLLTGFLFSQDLPAALGMKINQAILEGQYWRLITAMFLHGSIFHLGFNLYALYILGSRIERFFGSFRFLMLFLISGIAGNLLSFVFTPAPSLGSSTAIFGMLAAEGVFIYQHRELFGDRFRLALRQIIQVAVINFLIGLSPGIDNWGHLGGLIGGVIYTWFAGPYFRLEGAPPRLHFADQRSEKTAVIVFLVLLLVLILLTGWVILSRT